MSRVRGKRGQWVAYKWEERASVLGVLGRRGCSWGLVLDWKPPVPSLPCPSPLPCLFPLFPACHSVANLLFCGSPPASFICTLQSHSSR